MLSSQFRIRKDGPLLSKHRFIQRIREALAGCDNNPNKYTGGSFRIGVATSTGDRMPSSTKQCHCK